MSGRANERGQASVDLVATIPGLLLLALVAIQLALVGYGLWSAAVAARTGARADYVGADAKAAALGTLPAPLRGDTRVQTDENGVEVRVAVPSLVPGMGSLPIRARVALGATPEDAGGG